MISDEIDAAVGDDRAFSEDVFNKQENDDITNAFVKIENDPCVTKVGRIIRKFSIDELPQLSIFSGATCLLGNRPLPL